jgi:hypothetical protein
MLGRVHKNPFCVFAGRVLFAVSILFAGQFHLSSYSNSSCILTNYLHNLYLLFMLESHHS